MSLFDPIYNIYQALTDPSQALILLAAMFQVGVGWAVYGAMFTGLGLLVQRGFGLKPARVLDLLVAFWVGWAVTLGILQVWNLFFPVNLAAFAVIFVLSALSVIINAWELQVIVVRAWKNGWRYGVFLSVVGFFFANSALGPASEADFALYHQQAILWANEYPLVPGLANLHGRLGFNNAVFLYAALTNVAPFAGIGNHVSASLLLFALTALGTWGLYRTLNGSTDAETYFVLLSFPIVAWLATNNEYIRTPDSDLPTHVLTAVIMLMTLTVFKPSKHRLKTAYTVFVIGLLAAAGTISKLSFVAIGGAAMLTALFIYGRRYREGLIHLLSWVAVFGLWLGGVWLYRGVMMTGYVLFPATALPLQVDWRVPCDLAIAEANYIYSWARMPGVEPEMVLGSWRWLLPWTVRLLRLDFEVFTPLLITALALLYRVTHRPANPVRGWWLLVIPAFAFGFWFFTAPDVRFGGAIFWLAGNMVLAFVLTEAAQNHPQAVKVFILLLALLLSYDNRNTFLTYVPQDGSAFYPPREIAYSEFETDSGLILNIPDTRLGDDPEGDLRCYATALPCTPYPYADLQLREPGNLRSGFKFPDPLACDAINE